MTFDFPMFAMIPWAIAGLVLALPVGAFFLLRPSVMHVSRKIRIGKPREEVRQVVSDFRQWQHWSPWFKLEPEAKCLIDQESDPVGATMEWDGDLIGAGKLTTKAVEPGRIEHDIVFHRPFKSSATVGFDFHEICGETEVIWRMEARMPLILHKMMRAYIGMDYERGLLMLKEYCETGHVLSETEMVGEQTRPAFYYVGLERSCSFDELEASMQEAFPALIQAMERCGIESTGAPLTIYHKYDLIERHCDYAVALPVASGDQPELRDGLFVSSIPEHRALVLRHRGRYEHLGNPWSAGYLYLRNKKRKGAKDPNPHEHYRNDPESTPQAELETEICLPLR